MFNISLPSGYTSVAPHTVNDDNNNNNEMKSTKKNRMKQKQPSAICLHRLFVPLNARKKREMFTLHLCNCVWLNKKIIKQILYALGLDRDGTVYHRAMQMGGKKKR